VGGRRRVATLSGRVASVDGGDKSVGERRRTVKAVVLAAGEGTRMRPRTDTKPKPLVEVAGRPILTRCFETLLSVGIEEAVVVVGYAADRITERYGSSFRDLSLTYAHQPRRTGLAHAVLAASEYVDDEFVVANGDNVYAGNLSTALARHAESGADLTLLVEEVSPARAREGAVCRFDGDDLIGLVEKPDDPPSLGAPVPFYVLPPETLPACEVVRPSPRGEYELTDAIDLLLYSGYEAETVPFEGWRVNVNTERDRRRAERRLAETE
jgi:glucose-1-phosphate thymidylyltransferase